MPWTRRSQRAWQRRPNRPFDSIEFAMQKNSLDGHFELGRPRPAPTSVMSFATLRRYSATRSLPATWLKSSTARGGKASLGGMRLRCRVHNQYTAECTFGAEFMSNKREDARCAAAEKREATEKREAASCAEAGGSPLRADPPCIARGTRASGAGVPGATSGYAGLPPHPESIGNCGMNRPRPVAGSRSLRDAWEQQREVSCSRRACP